MFEKYGIEIEKILSRKKSYWTFNNFIKEIEGFNSLKQYDAWLYEMSEEDRENTRWYYTEKFAYILTLLEEERNEVLC